MSQNGEFDRLEQFVAQLLSQYNQLLEKNSQLQRLLQEKNNVISDLQSTVSSADSERGNISNRIKGLIDQIEEWQSNLPEVGEEVMQNDEEEQETAATADHAVSDSIEKEERDPNHQQRSLFHVERRTDVDYSG
jgi:uncharacterized coiled-coil DUF342 family protein